MDQVIPLQHTEKMLGLIAWLLATYLGVDLKGASSLEEICLPWSTDGRQSDGTSEVISQLRGLL